MNSTLKKLKTRGHWEVVIRPTEFVQNRFEETDLCKKVVRDLSVRFRGWDYPHYDTNKSPSTGLDFVEQSLDWQDKLEFWRYYQSGQFVHFFGMWEDWQDQRTMWGRPIGGKPGQLLSVLNAVYHLTEIYEFASRLAVKGHLGNKCTLSVTLHGTKDRQLAMLDPSRELHSDYICILPDVPRSTGLPTSELIAKSAELALDHIVWLFKRFNWDNVPKGVFQEDQKKLIERRL